MRNSDIEKLLNEEIENSVPDVLDKILLECEKIKKADEINKEENLAVSNEEITKDTVKENKVTHIKEKQVNKKSNFPGWLKLTSIAAAFAVFFAGSFMLKDEYSVNTRIYLDVNPSIEIGINKNNKIVSIKSVNDDADSIVTQRDYKGSKLDQGIEQLINSMIQAGYLCKDANSILVTIDGHNKESDSALEKALVEEINKILLANSIDGFIIGQNLSLTDNSEIINLTADKKISLGKAMLISRLLNNNPGKTFEDYESLSINDLNLIANTKKIPFTDSIVLGKPSDSKYIGSRNAVNKALSHLGTSLGKVKQLEVELDRENGIMVYEVEFYLGDYEYEYTVDATSGRIISHEKEYIGSEKINSIIKSNKSYDDDDDYDYDDDDDKKPTSSGSKPDKNNVTKPKDDDDDHKSDSSSSDDDDDEIDDSSDDSSDSSDDSSDSSDDD